ncbi:hypothetical protein PRK78_007136 [Emydomyces testavorans]|uniref:DNA replication regulator Sld3 C-terminal domain-containing protein n=1 Tax=Emydomyces testavorans TaxID=2070801 RepID=A0AAF0IL61_9EURO|nr:hypothetical protein PRK78_007136 [Emydomyces testavorans]
MAAFGSVTVLGPSSSASLNVQHGFSVPPLKRRRISPADLDYSAKYTLSSAISIHPSSSSLSDKPQILIPITLLPRSRLPLSWLDPCPSPLRSIHPGRLFVSNILALEAGLRDRKEPIVLAVRSYGERSTPTNSTGLVVGDNSQEELYVVERVKRGIYAICALAQWVGEGDLVVASKGWKAEECGDVPGLSCAGDELNWLERARIPQALDCEDLGNRPSSSMTLAFGQQEKSTDGAGTTDPSGGTHAREGDGSVELGSLYEAVYQRTETSPQVFGAKKADDSQGPRDLFDGLKTQYLETLYISKTSVAYFAKGPLARARAAFQPLGDDTSMRTSDLCYFYRECIIPVKKMDVKYRDSVPEVIRNLPLDMSQDDALVAFPMNGKKRKSKKRKIGKDGLYPYEEDLVAKWWRNRNVTDAPLRGASGEAELKRLLADLRFRETQLQILLILETLSLEGSANSSRRKTSDGPQPNKIPKKKSKDLGMLLELLVDRLCIWHTVGSDDGLLVDSDKGRGKNKAADNAENDKLRDFCTEVIIPFYASRLPEQCRGLSRKLGGPVTTSPKRTALSRQKSTAEGNDGENKKQKPQKPRRTLERVLTDGTAAAKRTVPSLLRNQTTTSLPELKRESSEPVSLSLASSRRGAIQKPKRMDNREIDLDAVVKQRETRLKKMNTLLEQQKELDAAINALRKPNRELVARDWADSAAKRASIGSAKKQKDPTRNPSGEGVQVMATPRCIRKKDCGMVRVPSFSNSEENPSRETASYPPYEADEQAVPSSASRPYHPFHPMFNPSRSDPKSILETPSKPVSHVPDSSPHSVDLKPQSSSTANTKDTPFKVPRLLPRSHPRLSAADITTPTKPSRSDTENGVADPCPGRSIHNDNVHFSFEVKETPPYRVPRRLSVPINSQITSVSSSKSIGSVIFSTPVKGSTFGSKRDASTAVQESIGLHSAEQSIYDQLGWDNDNDDDDELALPWSNVV